MFVKIFGLIIYLAFAEAIDPCYEMENDDILHDICSNGMVAYDNQVLKPEPSHIYNSMNLFRITNVNRKESTLSLTFDFILRWTDTRLNVTNAYANGTK